MTLAEAIYQRSLELPDAAAREALDFIEFLSLRYGVEEETAALPVDDAVTYDAWFGEQVQRAVDDPRPGVPAQAAREHFAARRDALRRQAEAKG